MPDFVASASAEIIRSRQNARLKDLRQRLLHPAVGDDGLIAIEGDHLLQEAERSGLRIDTVFLREDRIAEGNHAFSGRVKVLPVAADAFDHACATDSPQGIAALVQAPAWTLESMLNAAEPRLVILAGLQDPGNVGTIIRSAEAFAADGVLLTPGSVSPWNQKALRASAGSSFRLPVVSFANLSQLHRLAEKHIPTYACVADAGASISDSDLRGPIAFVIGNEGAGISDEVFNFCNGSIHVPCPGSVESLNAAIAASIVLYEASRQRSFASLESKL
ncbi:MAG TPA: RNA methyltransferase [Acidobacteriaceae bacterium]|nr:RNA methyltransferase [Acidobacteriaceae bacterium]